MTSQTSSLYIAIKSRKQPSNSVTTENCRTYWKRIIWNVPNHKDGKTSKADTIKLRQTNNHNKRIENLMHSKPCDNTSYLDHIQNRFLKSDSIKFSTLFS